MARGKQIPALTGIRGVAALGVVAYHYWFKNWVPPDTLARAAVARGYLFVDLFFLLSGFVMASSYGWMFSGRFDAVGYWRFLATRLARIYPVYFVLFVVFVAVAIARPGSADVDAKSLLANMTLTQAWFDIRSTILAAWSLSAELAVYIVFPVFVTALLTSRANMAKAVCATAFACLVILWIYNVQVGFFPSRGLDASRGGPAPMVRCFVGFALGVGVFRLKDAAWVKSVRSDQAIVAVLLLTVCLWLIPNTPDLVLYACLPPLLLCLAINRGPVAALFGSAVMVALGEWSYSIYLVHLLFMRERERVYLTLIRYMPSPFADAFGAALIFTLTIGASAALYTLVEVPARDRLRTMIGARRLPPDMEPSAP